MLPPAIAVNLAVPSHCTSLFRARGCQQDEVDSTSSAWHCCCCWQLLRLVCLLAQLELCTEAPLGSHY
jgi:hypothetical protein